ncbi:OmpA family protein [Rhodobacteraceae bacterium N5(2021)]|uniref:OmpA family protein n=1 Tax=Gymnodinialimonas phycosphaerae TaxID=2841589 RepID=A0A975YFA1_9RHOB|nr:OmpA family protein [Gymnodinialimonas phycosphaerae]MBY4894522.1 OmpA family protein [Gymnodinialimonas phycosphaerae]
MEIRIAPEATAPLTVATPDAVPEPAAPALGAEADCVATLDALAASITVPFDPYAVETTSGAMAPVVDLAQRVAECDTAYIVVAGPADPSGDETLNLVLSWQRAEFVVTHLTDTGFDRIRLEAIGFESRRPISEGAAGADDTLNRRVDFIVRAELP